MRSKIYISLLTGFFMFFCAANKVSAQTPYHSKAVKFVETIPLRDMPASTSGKGGREEEEEINETNREIIKQLDPDAKGTMDAALPKNLNQKNSSPLVMNPPTVSFEGIASSDNTALYGFTLLPSDDNG